MPYGKLTMDNFASRNYFFLLEFKYPASKRYAWQPGHHALVQTKIALSQLKKTQKGDILFSLLFVKVWLTTLLRTTWIRF